MDSLKLYCRDMKMEVDDGTLRVTYLYGKCGAHDARGGDSADPLIHVSHNPAAPSCFVILEVSPGHSKVLDTSSKNVLQPGGRARL